MNLVNICKYLKISPLVRKMGTPQVSSSDPVSEILTLNFKDAIEGLSGGESAQTQQALITQAYLDASIALKGHNDLTHLISTAEILGGVLEVIQLNEIQPLLMYLSCKEPSQKNLVASMCDNTWLDKLTVGYAATSVFQISALGAAASIYVIYRASGKFMQHMFGKPPESELERLITNESELRAATKSLSEIKLCEALMILRYVRSYQDIMEKFQLPENTLKFVLMGIDLSPELFLSIGTTLLREVELNKLKRLLREEEKTDNFFYRNLQNSKLLNLTVEKLGELFIEQEHKFRSIMMIILYLEKINVLDKITLLTRSEESWNNQLEAYQKIYTMFGIIKTEYDQLIELLNEDELFKLNDILKFFLPFHFYSNLQNALVTTIDKNVEDVFFTGRINYYQKNHYKLSYKDEEVKEKLKLCLPDIKKLLAVETEEEVFEPTYDATHNIFEEKDEDYNDSSDEDEYHDAKEGSVSSDESFTDKNFVTQNESYIESIKSELVPTAKLNSEELIILTQKLKDCLKQNCIRITSELYISAKSRKAMQKKTAFFTRCYVTLDHLVFDNEENIITNRAILASICVQISLVSSIETSHFSIFTEFSSDLLDKLVSTQVLGSKSFKQIKAILKEYDFHVVHTEKDLETIIKCFNDGIWPVLCGALFHFERSLHHSTSDLKLIETREFASSAFSYGFFSLSTRISAFLNPTNLGITLSGGAQMLQVYYNQLLHSMYSIYSQEGKPECPSGPEETKESSDSYAPI